MPIADVATAGVARAPRIPWWRILVVATASRLLLFFVGVFTLISHDRPAAFDWATWVELSCRWDCGWYGGIVQHGYGFADAGTHISNWAFYPVLPMLLKAVLSATPIDDFRVAGMLVSSTLFVFALALIHRYARLLGNNERVAMSSVLIVAFLPQSIVFSATYTESLFVFLLAGVMVAMREQRFLLAGICAALLSATRSNGVFAIVFIIAHLYLHLGREEFFRPWRNPLAFLPLLMAPLGAFAFWTYAYLATGDAFAMATTVRHGWGWSWQLPMSNLMMFWELGKEPRFWMLGSLFAAASSMLLLRYRWFAEFAFCAALFVLIWGGSVPNSLWRYSLVLFPAWIALARFLDTRETMRMGLFVAMGLVGGFVMHAWALQLLVAI